MDAKPRSGSVSEMQEQLEQHQTLIEQLKMMVRENEDGSRQKDHDLKESAAKLSKLKLQHKARVAQLTSQLNELQKIKATTSKSGEFEDDVVAETASPDHTSRGKVIMLKKKLEENRILFEKREKELADNKHSIESRLEEMQAKLDEKERQIQDMQTVEKSENPVTNTASNLQVQEMYAQMVYKDSRIVELNNRIFQLESNVMDLQENLKEKDEVIQSRNIAIQLMTEDLSRKGKNVVDQLDDTRDQMKAMQEHFVTVEAAWKEEQTRLNHDLEAMKEKHSNYVTESNNRVAELKASMAKLESVRFDLSARNAQLQEKIVNLQESLEKEKEKPKPAEDLASELKCLTEDKEQLQAELLSKDTQLQEVQTSSNKVVKSADQKLIKLKALHQNKIKALETQIQELKENNDLAEKITLLKNQLVELEEEKGNLQLKLVEFDDLQHSNDKMKTVMEELENSFKRANDDLDDHLKAIQLLESEKLHLAEQLNERTRALDEYKSLIENHNVEIRTLEDAKVSLEMRLVEIEELRDVFDGQKQELLKEVGSLRSKLEGDDKPVLAIEQEKMSLEVKLSEMENALQDSVERSSSLEKELEELQSHHHKITEQHDSLLNDQHNLSVEMISRQSNISELREQLNMLKETCSEKEDFIAHLARKYGCNEMTLESLDSTWEELLEKLQELNRCIEEREIIIETLQTELGQANDREELHKSEKEQLNQEIKERCVDVETLKEMIDVKTAENLSVTESNEIQAKENKFLEELLQRKEEAFVAKSQLVADLQRELESVQQERSVEIVKAESKVASLLNQMNDIETELGCLQRELDEKIVVIAEIRREKEAVEAERKLLLDKLEMEEKNLQDALDKINDLESTYLTENKMLKEEYNQMQQQLQNTQDEVETQRNSVACKEKELEQISHQLEMSLAYEDKVRSLQARLDDALNQNVEVEKQFQVLQDELDNKVNELNALRLRNSEIESDLVLAKNSHTATESSFVELAEKCRHLENELSATSSANDDLRSMLNTLELEIAAKQEEHANTITSYGTTISELKERQGILEEENADLNTKNQSLMNKVESLEDGNNNLSERLAAAQDSENSYSKEIESLQGKVKELSLSLDDSKQRLQEEVGRWLEKEKQLESNLISGKEDLANCEYALEKSEKIVCELTSQLENKTAQCVEAEMRINTMRADINLIEDLRAELQEVNEKCDADNLERNALVEKLVLLNEENNRLEQQLQHMGLTDTPMSELMLEKDGLVGRLDEARIRIDMLEIHVGQLEQERNTNHMSNEKLIMYIEQLETDLKSTAESLQAVEEERETLNQTILEKVEELKSLYKEKYKLENDKLDLKKENEELKMSIRIVEEEGEEEKQKVLEAVDQLNILSGEKSEMESERSAMQEQIEQLKVMIRTVDDEKEGMKQNFLDQAEKLENSTQEKCDVLQQQNEELRGLLQKSLEDAEEKLNYKQQQLDILDIQLQKVQYENEALVSKTEDSCANCDIKTDENGKLENKIEHLLEELHLAEEAKRSSESSLSEGDERRVLLEKKVEELQQERKELSALNENIEIALQDVNEQFSSMEQKSRSLQSEIDLRNGELSDLKLKFESDVKELESVLEETKASLEIEKTRVEDAMETVSFLSAEKKEVGKIVQDLRQDLHVLQAEKEALLHDVEVAKSQAVEHLENEGKVEEAVQKCAVEDEEKEQLKKQVQELRVKCGRMLAKLKAFKEKNDKSVSELSLIQSENEAVREELQEENQNLSARLDAAKEENGRLESKLKKLSEKEDCLEVANDGLIDVKERLELKLKEKIEHEESLAERITDLTLALEVSDEQIFSLKKEVEVLQKKVDVLQTGNEGLISMGATLEEELHELKVENEGFKNSLKEMARTEEMLLKKNEELSLQVETSKEDLENGLKTEVVLQAANSSLLEVNEQLKQEITEVTARFLEEKEDLEERLEEREDLEERFKEKEERYHKICEDLCAKLDFVQNEFENLTGRMVAVETSYADNAYVNEKLDRELNAMSSTLAQKESVLMKVKEENEIRLTKTCQELNLRIEKLNEENLQLRLNAVLHQDQNVQEIRERELMEETSELDKGKEEFETRIQEMLESKLESERKCQDLSAELNMLNREFDSLNEKYLVLETSSGELGNVKEILEQELANKNLLGAHKESLEENLKEVEEREQVLTKNCQDLNVRLEILNEDNLKLKVDLESASDALLAAKTYTEGQLRERNAEFAAQMDQYEAKLNNLLDGDESLMKKCKELSEEVETLNSENGQLQSELNAVMEKEKHQEADNVMLRNVKEELDIKIQEYSKIIQNLEMRIVDLEGRKAGEVEELDLRFAEEREKLNKEVLEIKEQNQYLESDNTEFQALNDQLRDAKLNLEQDMANMRSVLENKETLLQEVQGLLANSREETLQLNVEIQVLQQRISTVSAENDVLSDSLLKEKEVNGKLQEVIDSKSNVVVDNTELDSLSSQLMEKLQYTASLEKDIEEWRGKWEDGEKERKNVERRENSLLEEIQFLKSILLERDNKICELLQFITELEQLRLKLQKTEATLDSFFGKLALADVVQDPLSALTQVESYIWMLRNDNSSMEVRIEELSKMEMKMKQLQEEKRGLEIRVNKERLVRNFDESPDKVAILQAELQRTMQSLHARDIRCENFTMDISNLIEERDSLQLRLTNTLTREHQQELELRLLKQNSDRTNRPNDFPSRNESYVQQSQHTHGDLELRKQLEINENVRIEVQQMNAVLEQALASEREERINIQAQLKMTKEELAGLGRKNISDSVHIKFDEEEPLLVPENTKTLERSYTSTTWRIANWIQGRSTPRILHV